MENNDELEITLVLTVGEANKILKALQPLPFNEVVHIINKVHTQATPQISAAEKQSPVQAEVISPEADQEQTD